MMADTKYFGQVEFVDSDILHFPHGLFGFEEEKKFLLLPFAGGAGTLLCFQSLTTPGLAFVAVNPFSLKPDYAPTLPEPELKNFGVEHSQDLCWYALCVVRNPIAQSTVNLKCPVVVNEDTGVAAQVILEDGGYEMRHLLSDFGSKGESGKC